MGRRVLPAPEKKGGGGKTLLIVGGIAAVGGGVALAAGGGGGGDDGSGGSGGTSGGNAQNRTESGVVGDQESAGFTFVATRAGTAEMTVTWSDRNVALQINCQDEAPPYTPCPGSFNRTSDTSARYTTPVTPKTYLVVVGNFSGRPGREPFTLVISYP